MNWLPFLGAAALGFVKGLTAPAPADFSWEQDLIGPAKEEALFRGPLYFFPKTPYGTTAILFAAAHLESDWTVAQKAGVTMTPLEVLARLGDVFLGGLVYEQGMRRHGLPAAIGLHSTHNLACALGSRLR